MAKKKKKKPQPKARAPRLKVWPLALAAVTLATATFGYFHFTKQPLISLLPPPSSLHETLTAANAQRQRIWQLEAVEMVYSELRTGAARHRTLSPDHYGQVYQTLFDAREVRGPEEPLASRFEGRGVFHFRFPLVPQGKVSAGRSAPCRELQFCAEGDLFRLQQPSGRWRYFERDGVRAELLRVLACKDG